MKYKWGSAGFDANADEVGKELKGIENKQGLTNSNVLSYAKNNKDSELYKCFEWDDKKASDKYRLHQANLILTSITIVISEEPKETTRAFVNIKTKEENNVSTKSYKNIVKVLKNDEDYMQLKDKAEQEFVAYKKKYEKIVKLQDLKSIILKNI